MRLQTVWTRNPLRRNETNNRFGEMDFGGYPAKNAENSIFQTGTVIGK